MPSRDQVRKRSKSLGAMARKPRSPAKRKIKAEEETVKVEVEAKHSVRQRRSRSVEVVKVEKPSVTTRRRRTKEEEDDDDDDVVEVVPPPARPTTTAVEKEAEKDEQEEDDDKKSQTSVTSMVEEVTVVKRKEQSLELVVTTTQQTAADDDAIGRSETPTEPSLKIDFEKEKAATPSPKRKRSLSDDETQSEAPEKREKDDTKMQEPTSGSPKRKRSLSEASNAEAKSNGGPKDKAKTGEKVPAPTESSATTTGGSNEAEKDKPIVADQKQEPASNPKRKRSSSEASNEEARKGEKAKGKRSEKTPVRDKVSTRSSSIRRRTRSMSDASSKEQPAPTTTDEADKVSTRSASIRRRRTRSMSDAGSKEEPASTRSMRSRRRQLSKESTVAKDDDDDDEVVIVDAPSAPPTSQERREGKNNDGKQPPKEDDGDAVMVDAAPAPAPAEEQAPASTPASEKGAQEDRLPPAKMILPTKPAPTLDVTVHRLRHLNYTPRAVLCIRSMQPWVAISRDQGSVELWHTSLKFRRVAQIAGYPDKPVHVLAWTSTTKSKPVLVGGSRDGTLFVVDFERTHRFRAMTGSGGGGVSALIGAKNMVAAGCQDGCIRIYRVQESRLDLISTISSTGAAVLSLAWHWEGSRGCVLYAGVADGTIRRYESTIVKTQSSSTDSYNFHFDWKSSFRMTVESYGNSTPTMVWALQLVRGGDTLVSGDSLGHVQFWNAISGTLEQSFDQNDVKADVLDLAVTEKKVFASGVDSRVVCIEQRGEEWVLTQAQRPHTHDVHSLCIFTKEATDGADAEERLCSGGIDTKLCLYGTAGNLFDKRRPANVFPWVAHAVKVARTGRLLLLVRERQLDLYRLTSKLLPDNNSAVLPVAVKERDMLASLELPSSTNVAPSNICACEVSDDGRYVAVADAHAVTILRLEFDDKGALLKPAKLCLSDDLSRMQVATMRFSGNHLLVADTQGNIHTAKMPADDITVELQLIHKEAEQDQQHPVSIIEINETKRFLYVQHTGGLASDVAPIHIFEKDEDDNYSSWWKLPNLDAAVAAACFVDHEDGRVQIAVACINFRVYVYDVLKCRPTAVCREWMQQESQLPPDLAQRSDVPVRISVNPQAPHKLLVGTYGSFVTWDTQAPYPKRCQNFPEKTVRAGSTNRQMRQNDRGGPSCTVCYRYNSMLHLGFLNKNELVVVEQPWMDVMKSFPNALERQLYGTS